MIELEGRGLSASDVGALYKDARVSLSQKALESVQAILPFLKEQTTFERLIQDDL